MNKNIKTTFEYSIDILLYSRYRLIVRYSLPEFLYIFNTFIKDRYSFDLHFSFQSWSYFVYFYFRNVKYKEIKNLKEKYF